MDSPAKVKHERRQMLGFNSIFAHFEKFWWFWSFVIVTATSRIAASIKHSKSHQHIEDRIDVLERLRMDDRNQNSEDHKDIKKALRENSEDLEEVSVGIKEILVELGKRVPGQGLDRKGHS